MLAGIANGSNPEITDTGAFRLGTFRETRRVVMRVLRQEPGSGWRGLGALILLALGAWCAVLVPTLLGRIVDVVLEASAHGTPAAGESITGGAAGQATHQVLWLGAGLVLASLISALCNGLGFFFLAKLTEKTIANLREELIGTALGLPLHQVEDAGTGDLISRSTDDVAQVSTAVNMSMPVVTSSSFAIAATVAGLMQVDWRLLVVVLVAMPVYWFATRRYLRVAPERYAAERASMATRARRVLEAIHGGETIRVFRLEPEIRSGISTASEEVVTHGMRARMAMIALIMWTNVAELLLIVGVLLLGFFLVRGAVPGVGVGSVSVGAVTAAALMMIRVRGPIMMLMRVLDQVQSGYASLARIVGVVVDPPQPVADYGAPTAQGAVALRGVSFSYDAAGQAGVQDINLTIQPGQTVAIVGASGAGKSTVAALIMGMREADSGTVTIDGVPVTLLSDEERRERLAMVSQETHTFAGTLRDDVGVAGGRSARSGSEVGVAGGGRAQSGSAEVVAGGRSARSGDEAGEGHRAEQSFADSEILRALKRVGAMTWFNELPDGLDTVVGSNGVRLSPAQQQQVALARVLLADPAVVVLDEATAEAGSALAGDLERAAQEVVRGRTAVMVAHRLDQARHADQIVVMEDGKIVEVGSHDQLLNAASAGGGGADVGSVRSGGAGGARGSEAGAGPDGSGGDVGSGGRYAALWAAWSKGRG